MILNYHPDAVEELINAAQFYESRQNNLGHRFLDAVDTALKTIKKNPLIWQSDKLDRRKCPVKKFPYLLIYKLNNRIVYILAVAHTSRKPDYWKSRDRQKEL
ncbi:MAG: type II toxin-antitoxin system RelE/ParE family toxin [bacterium]